MNAALFLRGGPYFTEREVADLLRISDETLRRLRLAGKIGFQRIGRRVVYSQAHVDQFIRDTEEGPGRAPVPFRR